MKTKYKNGQLQKALEYNMPSLILCIILTLIIALCFGSSLFNTVLDISDGSGRSFLIALHDHPIGLAFGITLLYMCCVWELFSESVYALRDLCPACGKPRFSAADIDAQANHPEVVWYSGCAVYAAPDILIGTTCGITAVAYSDIAEVCITRKSNTRLVGYPTRSSFFQKRNYRKFNTYRITVTTKEHKRLYISNGTSAGDINALKAKILEKCGSDLVWVDKNM